MRNHVGVLQGVLYALLCIRGVILPYVHSFGNAAFYCVPIVILHCHLSCKYVNTRFCVFVAPYSTVWMYSHPSLGVYSVKNHPVPTWCDLLLAHVVHMIVCSRCMCACVNFSALVCHGILSC